MTHEFHNPDNLTPEQIGEGYRLLLKSEIKPRPENREINAWLGRFRRWTVHNDSMCVGSSQDLTYRVPLSTWPLPGSKWQAEREALSRGECVEAQLASDWAPDTWIRLDPNFAGDWDSLFAVRARPWTLGNSVNGFTLSEGQHGSAGQPDRLGPSVSLPPIETFSAAMESVTKQESPPTDNDSWECLLRTNAQLGKKVVELEKDSDFWKSRYEDAINATSFTQEEKESLGLLVGQDTVTDGILALRRQRDELQSKLTAAQDICAKALTLPAPPVVPVEDVKPLVAVLRYIRDETDQYADGAPDASAHDKLCLELCHRIQPALATFTVKHPNL